jgi:hypothetical protein
LLENSDLKDLNLKPSNHDLETQAELVRDGQLDLAAVVMNENVALIRTLTTKYDLEIVAPGDIEGPPLRRVLSHMFSRRTGFTNNLLPPSEAESPAASAIGQVAFEAPLPNGGRIDGFRWRRAIRMGQARHSVP